MLGFFRRITQSKLGLLAIFAVIGAAAFAMVAGDLTGYSSGASGSAGGPVATVGDKRIGAAELRQRVQVEMEGFRQQQPTLDLATFVQAGGLDGALQRMVTDLALEQFGARAGMVVSKRSIDGLIASNPALQGPTGKFDPNLYRRALVERKLTDAQVRQSIERGLLAAQLGERLEQPMPVPEQLALPYAGLLLERRAGQVAIVPVSGVAAGPTPTDAELQSFYQRNISRYSLPERRVARYAVVTPDQVRARATPTDAEIAQAYQAQRARFAATERRTVNQVVVADQAGANALAARVRGGASVVDAARAVGLEASAQNAVEKAAFAALTSPAIADQVFGAQRGAVVGPIRGPLGFVVARVEAIEQVAGRSLDQVRAELVTELTRQKTTDVLTEQRNQIDDALAGNATFDELISDRKLSAQTTPALTARGVDPTNPAARPDPLLAPIMTAVFQASEGDEPQVVAYGPDGGFAVAALARVAAAAPRPIAEVREQVGRDFIADRQRQAARRTAAQVVARVNRGETLAQALASTGLSLPAPRQIAASRAEVARAPESARPPLVALFGLQPGRAQLAPATDGSAFAIVRLEQVQRSDPRRNVAAIRGTRADFARLAGREYAEQFIRAIRNQVGVTIDQAAVAQVRAELLGQGGGQ